MLGLHAGRVRADGPPAAVLTAAAAAFGMALDASGRLAMPAEER